MSAMDRFIRREGRDAVLVEVDKSNLSTDDWGDEAGTLDDADHCRTDTKAMVRLMSSGDLTVTVAGEAIDVDAEIVVPSTLEVDPDKYDERPVLEVGGHRYKVWLVDDNGVEGARRLLATRMPAPVGG